MNLTNFIKTILCLLFVNSGIHAQSNCNVDEVIVTDFRCTENGPVFNLTVTSNGVPRTVTGSQYVIFTYKNSSDDVLSFVSNYRDGDNSLLDNYQVSPETQIFLGDGVECADLDGQVLQLSSLGSEQCNEEMICTTFGLPDPVPTLSQWGLSILFLSIVIIGILFYIGERDSGIEMMPENTELY